jgi:hypothetical protein
LIEDHAEHVHSGQPEMPAEEVQHGEATPSRIENQAVLHEILYGPPADRPEDDYDVVDPQEWEPVQFTWDDLLGYLKSIEKTYERTPWSMRRFRLEGWLNEVSESFGPFKCLDDLSAALRSMDSNDVPLHPLLQAHGRAGRPKLTRIEFRNRCMIALAIDALKMAGWSIEQSARAVADWLSNRSIVGVRIRTIRYSSVPLSSWETIKNWREEIVRIAQGKGQHRRSIREIATDYLNQKARLHKVIAEKSKDPKNLARLLLEQMRPLPRIGENH